MNNALRRLAHVSVVVATLVATARVRAQEIETGSISGAVVDTDTHSPLSGAVVILQPDQAGVLPGGQAGATAFASSGRSHVTDMDGAYRFANLPSGRYRLDAVRPGYRPYSVVVDLSGAVSSAVVLGLSVAPIPLDPLRLHATPEDPFPRTNTRDAALRFGALPPLRLAPGVALSTDAWEMTRSDVTEAVTLGEPDLFRAVQRMPGIGTRSDYTAELWTRGAAWHETRIYFDGLPVFDPLHGLGSLSGISPGSVGAMWVFPGVHPASLPEGTAGAVQVKSRRGTGEGKLNGSVDLSVLSTSVSLDQRRSDGKADWMFAARRTSMDWLPTFARFGNADVALRIPQNFWDASARGTVRLSESQSFEVSGLHQLDAWECNRSLDPVCADHAEWGSTVGRASIVSKTDRVEARHTLGFSRRAGDVRTEVNTSLLPADFQTWEPDGVLPTHSQLTYGMVSGEWRHVTAGPAGWAFGYDFVRESGEYRGGEALPVPRQTAASPSGGFIANDSVFDWHDGLSIGAAWGERTLLLNSRFVLQAALRVEAGDAVLDAVAVRPAPRVTARYQLGQNLTVSAALGRTYQYAQSLAPAGLRKASSSSDHVWIVAGANTPALRSDVATFGMEAWIPAGWLVSANTYFRMSDNVLIPDLTPGPARLRRPLFTAGSSKSRGAEMSMRRVAPAWSVYGAYSFGKADVDAGELHFPSSADRRHAFDATGIIKISAPLRIGAALTVASGIPYTRITQMRDVKTNTNVPVLGPPNGERGPVYASLDLLTDWTTKLFGYEVGAYVQLRNALDRDNGTYYVESSPGCVIDWCGARALLENRYEKGLPRLPFIGVRARF